MSEPLDARPLISLVVPVLNEEDNLGPLVERVAAVMAQVADRYDYYYVPTFYVGDKKVHEGGIMHDEVEAVLRMALDER